MYGDQDTPNVRGCKNRIMLRSIEEAPDVRIYRANDDGTLVLVGTQAPTYWGDDYRNDQKAYNRRNKR